jgi:hypothetical protein
LVVLAAVAMPAVIAPRAAWAIGGGTVDETNEYASACAVLGLREGAPPRIASGVLIHPRVVLTAGHVIDWFANVWHTPPEDVRISFDLDAYDDEATWLEVKDYMPHPMYNGAGGFGDPHDLGVLILEEPVTEIEPAVLPEEGLLDLLKAAGLLQFGLAGGTPMTVVGYGRGFSFPPPADVRADRGVRRFGTIPCMGMTLAHLHFFQDPDGVNSQRGDSGGPTFLETENGRVLLAVCSWGGVGAYTGIDHRYRIDTADALAFIDATLLSVEGEQ